MALYQCSHLVHSLAHRIHWNHSVPKWSSQSSSVRHLLGNTKLDFKLNLIFTDSYKLVTLINITNRTLISGEQRRQSATKMQICCQYISMHNADTPVPCMQTVLLSMTGARYAGLAPNILYYLVRLKNFCAQTQPELAWCDATLVALWQAVAALNHWMSLNLSLNAQPASVLT